MEGGSREARGIAGTGASPAPFAPRTVLITGGAGFIGSNVVRWLLRREPGVRVINLDLLTYAGNPESLSDVEAAHGAGGDGRYVFVRGDIRDASLVAALLENGGSTAQLPGPPAPVDAVLHFAAETHVDRSILTPGAFVSTNVLGTGVLLECARQELAARPRAFRFLNVSTNEVYGSLQPHDQPFTERSPLAPNSPYSASKAGADLLVRAYAETFGMPCLTTRSSNNYGPWQFPEKLIPLMITRALQNEPLPVYGDGLNVRDWLHVEDHAEAIWAVCTRGDVAEGVYNIGGETEISNIDVVTRLLDILGKPRSLVTFVNDRPGHDRRYAMDITKIRTLLGWSPQRSFAAGLEATVAWYRANESWWRRVRSEAHRASAALYGVRP